jgi:hypothetical protein
MAERVLTHVLNHPEVGAIIGLWQENCPELSYERQHTEGETGSGVAGKAAGCRRNPQPHRGPLGNCCSIHLSYGGVPIRIRNLRVAD